MKRASGLVLMSMRWRQRRHAVQNCKSRQIMTQIITGAVLLFTWRRWLLLLNVQFKKVLDINIDFLTCTLKHVTCTLSHFALQTT